MNDKLKVKIRIETKTVKSEELLPGDLFSIAGPEYWSNVNLAGEGDIGPIGEKVYIRTNSPVQEDDGDEEVTLVTLSYVREDGRVRPSRAHESYHIEINWDEEGNRIAELTPNSNCPYCRGEEIQVSDTDEGEATNATIS